MNSLVEPSHLYWTVVISDSVTSLALVTLAFGVYALVRTIRLPFSNVLLTFGLLLAVCNMIRFLEDWADPTTRFGLSDTFLRITTALAATAAVGLVLFLRPRLLKIAQAAEESEVQRLQLKNQTHTLSRTNSELIEQKENLRRSEGHLRRILDDLEVRVEERTLELTESVHELEASRKTYEDLVNTIDGIVWESKVGISPYTFVSRRAEKILGYPVQRWLSESGFWQRIMHPEDLVQFTGTHYRSLEAKHDRQSEYRVIAANGEIVWLKDFVTVVHKNGRPSHFRGIMVDITERKRIEESLTLALEAAKMATWDLDLTTDKAQNSVRHAQIFGYTEASPQWGWKAFVDHIHPEDQPLAQKCFEQALESGQLKLDCRIVWPDGSIRWIAKRGSVYRDVQGRPLRITGIVMDVTDLNQAALLALEASKLKSEFLANMSHEIRTPLNAIIGMASLVLDSKLSPSQRNDVNTIKRSGDSLLSLINDILDFSKIEAGKLELEVLDFDLKELLSNAIEQISLKSEEKKLRIETRVSAEVPGALKGDSGRILQILVNFLSNAVKFTESGSIELSVNAKPTNAPGPLTIDFEVSDTGIGMERKTVDLLFKPFSQGDGSMARKYGGTGLGLSICKRLAEMMGGRIGAESTPGKGSKFWVSLPLEPAHRGAAPVQESVFKPVKRSHSKRILIAEDNAANQRVILRFFEKLGHRANAVANGMEVLRATERKSYDMIFMDCQMPEMDGYQAARELRQRERAAGKSRTPIIALTAHALSGDRGKCLEAGMDDYITKPVVFSVLEKTVEAWSSKNGELLRAGAPKPPLPAPASSPPLPTLDQEYLRSLEALQIKGMPDVVLEVADIFHKTAPSRFKVMKRLLAEKKLEELSREAHAMKSTSGSIGARKMIDICRQVENIAKGDGSPQPEGGTGHLNALLATLENEIDDVEDALSQIRSKRGA